jgi:hypothetical protein
MGLVALIFVVSSFWAAIHAINRYKTSPSLLPTFHVRNRRQRLWDLSSTNVTLHHAHLKVSTTAWNHRHDRLAGRLAGPLAGVKSCLSVFYDLGCIIGMIGMVIAIAILLWTTWSLGTNLFVASGQHKTEMRSRIKRDLHSETLAPYSDGLLKPIASAYFVLRSFRGANERLDSRCKCPLSTFTAYSVCRLHWPGRS